MSQFTCILDLLWIIVSVLAATLISVYIYFVVKISKDIFNPNAYESAIDFYSDYDKTRTMQWVISAIFSVMIIVLSLSIMYKLKVRFPDFYAEFGCYFWTVFTIQILSMLTMTTIEILRMYNEAVIELPTKINAVQYAILAVVVNIFTTIVPMITQLSCLLF